MKATMKVESDHHYGGGTIYLIFSMAEMEKGCCGSQKEVDVVVVKGSVKADTIEVEGGGYVWWIFTKKDDELCIIGASTTKIENWI